MRTRRREATRLEILDAARLVYTEVGLHEARMETIAARAGVSVGTLYNYFDDRDALVKALCERDRDELMVAVDAQLASHANALFADRLQAFIQAILSHFEARRGLMTAIMENSFDSADSQSWSQASKETMRQLYARAEKLCEHGSNDGTLRSDDAAVYPIMLLGSIRGMMVLRLFKKTGDLSDAAKPIRDFFMFGASQGSKR